MKHLLVKQKKIYLITSIVLICCLSLPAYAKIKSVSTIDESIVAETTKVSENKQETTAVKAGVSEATETKKEETKAKETSKQETKAAQVDITKTAEYQALLAQYQAALIAQAQAEANAKANEAIVSNGASDTIGTWKREIDWWVFYDTDGNKIKNQFITYNNNKYYLDEFGRMSTSWKKINSYWYLFGKNGEMITGWYRDGKDYYYLEPETGKMVNSDRYIDGEVCHFTSEGKYIDDLSSYQTADFSQYIKSLIKYVDNKTNVKKVTPDSEFKKNINKCIDNLPRDVLSKMSAGLKEIYICMNQADRKNYMRSSSYKDEDGDRTYEYLPFTTSKTVIYVDGSNPYYLYFAIGEWLAKTIEYQGAKLYNTAVWKAMSSPTGQVIDELLSLSGTNGLQFYYSDSLASLACTIGWYLIDPFTLKEANDSAYKFVAQHIDLSSGSPLNNN